MGESVTRLKGLDRRRCELEESMPSFASAISLLCHFIRKLKQRLRRRIVGQAEVVVDLGVF